MKSKRLSIALMGTRGVPAKYGGFETCVDEVGRRLVDRGHDVTVYCRSSYYPPKERRDTFAGMRLIYLPNLKKKSLDTFSHTFLSVLDALKRQFDVHMVFNAANALFILPLRLTGKAIAVNTDGLEWKRSKWGFAGRKFYIFSERVACLAANRLVSDSKGIRDYYLTQHHVDSTEIAYGAQIQRCANISRIESLGLEPNNYFLQITRFEPENYPLLSIEAYNRLKTKKKLVIVGGNPYPNSYTQSIQKESSANVFLPGFIYDQDLLKELWCNCYAYIHGNSVGGTNPALLQTMASGCFTIASDNAFNHDVLNNCGIYYKTNVNSLAEKLRWALDHEDQLESYRRKAQQRIREHYNWDRITDHYELLFYDLLNGKYPWRPFQKFILKLSRLIQKK